MSYSIIIQKPTGDVVRETEDDLPSDDVLKYWEDFYTDRCNFCSPRKSVVINVFQIAEDI